MVSTVISDITGWGARLVGNTISEHYMYILI